MFAPQNRDDIRQVYLTTWEKMQQVKPLAPLEALIAGVIKQHPEYHDLLANPQQAVNQEFTADNGQSNPFLHMGLHITLQEQISIDQPVGISALFTQLVQQWGDKHTAEHQVIECLGEMIWQAQQHQRPPDEQRYLECLRRRLTQR